MSIEMKTLTIGSNTYEIVDEDARTAASQAVKTVNGIAPDENGNVAVEGGSVTVDTTLSVEGQAADAKATGDAISNLSSKKVNLPKDTDGNVIHGTAGWYAVSDGAGGITWVESAPDSGGDSGGESEGDTSTDVEEVIAHTWSSGIWTYDADTETWSVSSSIISRCCIQQQIDATDGYLKIRFNRQDSYEQYMSDATTDCPMAQFVVANGSYCLPTTRLNNLGNAALTGIATGRWQKLEWDTDYYLPAGYIYMIQLPRSTTPYVLDEDSLVLTQSTTTFALGTSNANLKSIVTTDGFCTITKITSSSVGTEVSVASSVDAQYTQELGISTMSLVPDDVESEPTTYTGAMKKAVSEWMIAYKGDTRKIPVIVHTDQHGRLTSANKTIFTALGNLVPWYDVSKIMNLGDCVGDHWNDADTDNPFLACGELEAMMECIADIPISKRLDVFGNHDTWYHDADGNEIVVQDQARLSQYFRNIFARNPNSNQQGYFTVRDDYYNVKYVVISGFEYTTSRSTYRISTAQMQWAIEELGKDDGYDIVIVSHVPLYYQPSTEVYPTDMTPSDAGSETVSRLSNVDTDTLFNARKNKTSGTVTDSDGVEHNFDFSDCTTDILCGLHGHIHMDGYNYVGGSGLVNVTFDWFADNTLHFVLVDRVNRHLNVWKVDSTNTMLNYQIPMDKPTE